MIELKNYGTHTINMATEGQIISVKPMQCCRIPKELYKTYVTIFPSLRPVVEYAIIESEAEEIETPKPVKKSVKGKKRK